MSKAPVGLEDRFEDLDDKDVYDRVKVEAASDKATNFVVEFNLDQARIALNLRHEDFGVLLGQKAPKGTLIGNRYGFSQRLQAIMMAPPLPSLPKICKKQLLSKQNDIESVSTCNENKAQPSAWTTSQSSEDLEIYQIIKETVNYTSIDRGKQYRSNEEPPKVLPPWHWSWITLCSDSIVVSFHETPQTEQPERDDWAREELQSMRSNTLSVLFQLSKHGTTDFSDRLISFKRVRQAMTEMDSESDMACEGSSNLFYYLFEDYSSAMPVLKASKLRLEQLRSGFWELGKRRERPRCFAMLSEGKNADFDFYRTDEAKPRRTMSSRLQGEVNISLSARSRFERLGDRLQLLMLNTIQGCLEEQKALSDTYFSLTAQKDSQATARLSRSATLLAKLSVFFLPITFMTSYFSLEIPDLVEHYTPETYWICFAVIASLSFISLFFFSRMLEVVSDTLEGWADYVSRKASNLVGWDTHEDRSEQ
ncbi:ADP-ribosylation factor [Colletotrichum somersetense]|nr:ADP-ribosylation factor [Colletotrichum somersetense]